MKKMGCFNCGNCKRTTKDGIVETRCSINNRYIGYLEFFSDWCKHWKKDHTFDRTEMEDE